MALPPDLRLVCRTLTATPVDALPQCCPSLVKRVLRCGGPLSAPLELKGADRANEAAVLVHQLKTQINSLLVGRSPSGRLAGMVLAKAAVDVGGWECLRTSEPWVRGCLSLLQVGQDEGRGGDGRT